MLIEIASWLAIVMFGVSYWLQIYKIHLHREVRDLCLSTFALLLGGYIIMFFKAFQEQSNVFMFRQIFTAVPVAIILFQIWRHRKEKWHDEIDPFCDKCGGEVEESWKFCPYCGDEAMTEWAAQRKKLSKFK